MKVLVILASYNGIKYIKEQINSILNQIDVELSIKIFDDGSNDGTIEFLSHLSNKKRISLFINSRNTGSAAKNFCNSIKQISVEEFKKYDYVALSDQDDIWLPNKLKIAVDSLASKNAHLYASNLILWENNIEKFVIKKDYQQKKFDYLFEGGSAGCTYVFTSDFALKLQNKLFEINYENWLYFSHDWLIYFFARLNNLIVFIDSRTEILYRIHDSNVHGQLNNKNFSAFTKRLNFVLNGWYFEHIKGFSQFLNSDSIEFKIYNLYNKNWLTRFWILIRYNFLLVRSKRKFLKFFALSLLPKTN
jgi:rhamnosyltransferase